MYTVIHTDRGTKKHATNEQHFHPQIHYSIKDFDFAAYEMVELHVGDYRYYKIC